MVKTFVRLVASGKSVQLFVVLRICVIKSEFWCFQRYKKKTMDFEEP